MRLKSAIVITEQCNARNELQNLLINQLNPNDLVPNIRNYVSNSEERINTLSEQSHNIFNSLGKKIANLSLEEKQQLELKLHDLNSTPHIQGQVREIEQRWRSFQAQGVEFRLEGDDATQPINEDQVVIVSSEHAIDNENALNLLERFDSNETVLIAVHSEERLQVSPGIVGFLTVSTGSDWDLSPDVSSPQDPPERSYYMYCSQVMKKIARLQPKIVLDALKQADIPAENISIPRSLNFIQIKKTGLDSPFFLQDPTIKREVLQDYRQEVQNVINEQNLDESLFERICEASMGLLEGHFTLPLLSVLPEMLIATQFTQDDLTKGLLTIRALLLSLQSLRVALPVDPVRLIFHKVLNTGNRVLITDGQLMNNLPAVLRDEIVEAFAGAHGITVSSTDIQNMRSLHESWSSQD